MKKAILFIFLSVILAAAGCKKEQYVPNRTIITNLSSSDWRPVDGGRTYTATINMPEIDNYFNERGGVLIYFSFDNGVYEQIPQVYNGVSYSYLTRSGEIVFEIQSSDGIGVVTPPGALRVKIILIESN